MKGLSYLIIWVQDFQPGHFILLNRLNMKGYTLCKSFLMDLQYLGGMSPEKPVQLSLFINV